MKLDKAVVDRRIHLMEEEGVKFVTNVNVGKDIKAEELLKQFDRVILACGASNPRDIKVPLILDLFLGTLILVNWT